ncbi:MAG TPA: flavin reductase family protein [Solirubrobacteraceae bacterium]|jgi:flavin reductase (DIM6/NTAB) family NADH-FMN oxidoreductase RutF|nr:flavin reductase family protein [Solirubrobacteraceae bacterium]
MGAPARAELVQVPAAHAFRDALARFATGVAFVTAAPGGEPAGLVVNSLASVSLDPPLISFCPSRGSLTWRRMRRAGRFGVNVLRLHHEEFVARATPPRADRFGDLGWAPGPGGAPLLTDALATLECAIVAEHAAGDHTIVVGQVERLAAAGADDPLVFYRGAFRTVR